MTSAGAAVEQTGRALRDAVADARRSWTATAGAGAGVVAIAAVAPLVVGAWIATDTLAGGAYNALAATGLALCVGLAGVPSLAQGAFVATGAFASAHLLRHTGLTGEVCAVAGAVAATGVGVAAGFAVRSLDAVRVAVGTWLLTWLVALALAALPWLSGGAQGLVVPERRLFGLSPTPLVHYELAVVLTAFCALALVTLRRAPFGNDLAAGEQHRGAATALGVPLERLRVRAFAASAFVGGLAGGFAVQLDVVADPTAYGPLLSFELLVAVLVGGAAAALGPSAGVVVLGLLALAARLFADLAGASTSQFQPMLEALLVLALLATGSSALVPSVEATLRRFLGRNEPMPPLERAPALTTLRGSVRATDLEKRYGPIPAADGVSLELAPGTVTALVGPNGSGKTTVLRLLAGAALPDRGQILLGDADLTLATPAERVQHGIVRTLQSHAIFPDLTALETVLVGVNRTRRFAGPVRAVTSTPRFRAETRAARARGLAALDHVGLAGAAYTRASELTSAEQRRLMIAAALATDPAILLLDEPAAGASDEDVQQLARTLLGLKEAGLGILLVEHRPRLVAAVADRVVELEQGRVRVDI